MRIKQLPLAALEAEEAAAWYEHRSSGLGEAFLSELSSTRQHIAKRPESFAKLEGYVGPLEVRRVLLHRFPFVVVFVPLDDEVLVVAISHAQRKPLYWLDRLKPNRS